MKKKIEKKPFQEGQTVRYIGKGFLGFDRADTDIVFIAPNGLADVYVTYKGNKMLVRNYEIEHKL